MQAYPPIHNKHIKLLPSSLKAPERFSTLSFNIPCLITLLSCLIYTEPPCWLSVALCLQCKMLLVGLITKSIRRAGDTTGFIISTLTKFASLRKEEGKMLKTWWFPYGYFCNPAKSVARTECLIVCGDGVMMLRR